jgi:hypothetical protein
MLSKACLQEADRQAAEAMRKTEAIVKDELEAAAVYAQVKAACEAASKSLAQLHTQDEEEMTMETIDLDEIRQHVRHACHELIRCHHTGRG